MFDVATGVLAAHVTFTACISNVLELVGFLLRRHRRVSCTSRRIHIAVTGKEISMNVRSVDKKTANESTI